MKIVKGDATVPDGAGHKLIMHICNNCGRWGKGFVKNISKRWLKPEKAYRKLDAYNLGDIQVVPVTDGVTVVNMIAQNGFGGVAVDYNALHECLIKVRETARRLNASVHGPKIGTGLGGGDWHIIARLIDDELSDHNVAVTIYEQ